MVQGLAFRVLSPLRPLAHALAGRSPFISLSSQVVVAVVLYSLLSLSLSLSLFALKNLTSLLTSRP